MKNIILLGSGNVATHLGIALKNSNYTIVQVYSKSIENAKKLAKKLDAQFTNNLSKLKSSDLIIVCINDDAILSVLSQIKNTAIVHTSGSIGLDVFKQKFTNYGVFYPLQTFNKEIDINISEIPFCIEGNSLEFEKQLIKIAKALSNNVVKMNSQQRKQLHIAAVFVNNFTNHMYSQGKLICDEHKVPFEILYPLIEETAKKIQLISPNDAQTGPAKRNDQQTIQNHLENLNSQQQEIYQLLTKSIQKK